MSPPVIGLIGIGIFVLFLLMRMPIFIAMALIGFAGFSYLVSPQGGLALLAKDINSTLTSYGFTVIPLFVLMGEFAHVTGIGNRVYSVMYDWLGHFRGGLAMATIGTCAAFSAICGSVVATSATVGTVAIPEMKRYGYDDALACGSVAAGGTLGVLIPPSMSAVMYAIIAQVSIGKCLMAGVLPGLLVAFLFMIAVYIITGINPSLGPAGPAVSWSKRFKGLTGLWETFLLFVLVIGGLFIGLFTPTEAAGVGALGCFLLGLARQGLTTKGFVSALFDTLASSCMVMMIIVGAYIFGHFLVVSRIPDVAAAWLVGLGLPPIGLWLLLGLLYVIIGCFIETMPIFVISIPIFAPLCVALGYDLIWFCVFLTVALNIGMITPPVGLSSYVVKGVAPDVPIETIFKGTWPFTAAYCVALVILVLWPQISLFLPGLMG